MERWPLPRLRPKPRNSHKHEADQIEAIAAAMRAYGWTMPALVDETGVILAGEGRWRAGQLNGYAEAPVIVARDWSEQQKLPTSLPTTSLASGLNGTRTSWRSSLRS
jgi:ParB-like chromosome segregation protein Spo0J